MISEHTLCEAVNRLVSVANPVKVILFGSYATGEATEDSDLDLMVIEPEAGITGQARFILRDAVGDIGTGVDVLVFSEKEANQRGQVPGTVIYWALKEGKVMYEAPTH
ncbi:MAG: nucleotidyltransferase domain-containing protein [Nitrospirae bacterium]|nr:nucleotidyltransferase domain-containing protein [Magnetococcales bacterium]